MCLILEILQYISWIWVWANYDISDLQKKAIFLPWHQFILFPVVQHTCKRDKTTSTCVIGSTQGSWCFTHIMNSLIETKMENGNIKTVDNMYVNQTGSKSNYSVIQDNYELEQLERLRSDIPPTAPWLPILGSHIRSQVKTRQSQSYKFKKKLPKILILKFCKKLATHLLKLLDKMYKYAMDPTRTVGTTEPTRDTGRTDRRTDRVKPPPPTTSLCRV